MQSTLAHKPPSAEECAKIAAKLTNSDLDALGWVCMSQAINAKKKNLRKLVKLGLIEETTKTIPAEPRKGPVYSFPIIVRDWSPVGLWVTEFWAACCDEIVEPEDLL